MVNFLVGLEVKFGVESVGNIFLLGEKLLGLLDTQPNPLSVLDWLVDRSEVRLRPCICLEGV
jgi:hypothetical protein